MIQTAVNNICTAFARFEESLFPKAVLLRAFPFSIQLNGYSCGSKSVYTVLRYFHRRCTISSVEHQLNTNWEGTDYSDIKRVIRERGLRGREAYRLKDLKRAIDQGSPVIISLFDNWHWSVLYGYDNSAGVLFVMNPSLNPFSMGSLSCVVKKKDFLKMWDRFGLQIFDYERRQKK